jgi:benzoyl-CoA reductase subunit D
MAEFVTAGIDVGTGAVKAAITRSDPGTGAATVLAVCRERLHRRDPARVAELTFESVLAAAGVSRGDLAYVASTGEGEAVDFRDGHFYGMTTHARGASHLVEGARSVVDVGALHARAMAIDDRSRVLRCRMTSQCASGTGQFVENIARYLGVRLDEVGPLSVAATRAETCSGICAVLAETDVINMVSRGVAIGEILRGIHDSIAVRLVKLLRALKAESRVVLTGGLAADEGLKAALERAIASDGGAPLEVVAVGHSVYAGALGAALWGAFRRAKLARQEAGLNPSLSPLSLPAKPAA